MPFITVRFNTEGLVSERFSTHNHDLSLDRNPPTLSLSGSPSVNIPAESLYVDAGATAIDEVDGDISDRIVVNNPVDTSEPGTYTITYNVSDSSGNQATPITRTVIVGDLTPPSITLLGNPTITIDEGEGFSDPGAIATDNTDGDITDEIVVDNPVDSDTPGEYTIRYNVSDSAGNIAQEMSRTVVVRDVTPPVIELLGNNPANVIVGTIYEDEGATATDNVDGNLTDEIVVDNQVNDSVVGSYEVTYSVADSAGNVAEPVTRTVFVQNADGIPPVIELIGSSTVTITEGEVYNDAGATAHDDVDGDLTENIEVTSDVDTETAGTYEVKYNVSDQTGNDAEEVIRTVVVREPDTEPPVIELVGPSTVSMFQHDVYTDEGATAFDGRDGNLTSSIEVTDLVDTSTVGTYEVRYNVSDSAGNAADEVVRTVSVQDGEFPVIEMLGESPVVHPVGDTYEDAGATAFDKQDEDLTEDIEVTSTVNTDEVGEYTVTYEVVDSQGNPALSVTRVVKVVDTDPPEITLLGDSTVTLVQGETYEDEGATAFDTQDGDLTDDIVVDNPVDNNAVGTYNVTYNVTDSAGNVAQEIARTVHVTDGIPPDITILGDNPVTHLRSYPYDDEGATASDSQDGDLTSAVETRGTVNVNQLGSYDITYTVSDAVGNEATAVRTVDVVEPDDEPPEITLLGDNPATVTAGSQYVDAGATATDAVDGDLTGQIVRVESVNTDEPGEYTVTYNVTDAARNEAEEVVRTVIVEPLDAAPVITMVGASTVFLDLGATFDDPGAVAEDSQDGDLTSDVESTSDVDESRAGVYSVIYTVSDSAGNQADPVTRTVIVESDQEVLMTTNHDLELPHREHMLEEDVERLRQTIMALDVLVKAAMSDLTDTSSDKLIINGGHGLGAIEGEAIVLDSVDLDTRLNNIRAYCTNCSNRPGDAGNGWLTVDPGSSTGFTTQVYIEATTARMWRRTEVSGSWGSWKRIMFQEDVDSVLDTNRVSKTYLGSPGGLTADYSYLLGASGSYILPSVGSLSAGDAVQVSKTFDAGNPTLVVEGGSSEEIRTSEGSDTSLVLSARAEVTLVFNGVDWEL